MSRPVSGVDHGGRAANPVVVTQGLAIDKYVIQISGLQAGRVQSSSSRSSGKVIHCTGFCVSATVAAQEWTAIAVDTAVARRSTVPRRLGSSTFKDDN
jgi:hypothetical protein